VYNDGNAAGTYNNPREWYLDQENLPSASPVLFNQIGNEPSDRYSRYLKINKQF
jgi:hypothetical protein